MKRGIVGCVSGLVAVAGAALVSGCSADPMADGPTVVADPLPACAFADPADLLTMVGESDLADRLAWPIVFDHVDCAGDWAVAHTMPDGRTQPTGVLFGFSAGTWRPVDVGSAIDCVALGVPAVDAGRIAGCAGPPTH